MKTIFNKCLKKAQQGAQQQLNLQPNHFIVAIQSETLDYGINSHLKQIEQASIDELLTLMEKVDQSNMAKERESICNGIFTVDVMAVQTKGRRGTKRKLLGGARKNEFPYNMYPGALYDHFPFPDGYCLFLSLEWARKKHLLNRRNFLTWKRNPRAQLRDAKQLMAACGILEGLTQYSIMDCGRHIQVFKLRIENQE